ncbi:unnamed protein product [Microthlaspi erraticum]|uniref:Aspartic peptidase DDI1-type domain-containing protein n=1 Tax=Microthlaspi erraticum TaxID=1685480 RepID=A0A6D2HJ47_9BRAS|nr:unnamed protein product [Microthlaspi erraticum]
MMMRLLLLRLLESRLINQKCRHLLWPFTLHQLSSHNKLDRQLDRVDSSSIESDLICPKPFCLILTNRLPLPRLAYLVKGTRKGPEESTHQFNLLTSPTFLPKVKDQGKFTLPCTLGHLELDNALVDSGASINLISLSMAEKLGIAGALQRPTTSIMFGDATSKSPLGVFKNYHLKIGECIIQTDLLYKVVKERVDKEPRVGKDKVERGPRIEKPRLERARVEKPRSDRPRADRLVQAPCVLDEESLQALFDEPLGRALKEGEDVASKARPGDKRKDPPAQAPSFKPSQLTMTLFPTKFENGKIEYKIRYKGRSRPFSRAKALVTSEQSRDPTKLKELLSQVLTITLDGGTSSTNA